MPPNNLDVGVGIISDLEEVKAVVVPVVALSNIAVIEVIVHVVVVTEVVGRVDPAALHQ